MPFCRSPSRRSKSAPGRSAPTVPKSGAVQCGLAASVTRAGNSSPSSPAGRRTRQNGLDCGRRRLEALLAVPSSATPDPTRSPAVVRPPPPIRRRSSGKSARFRPEARRARTASPPRTPCGRLVESPDGPGVIPDAAVATLPPGDPSGRGGRSRRRSTPARSSPSASQCRHGTPAAAARRRPESTRAPWRR